MHLFSLNYLLSPIFIVYYFTSNEYSKIRKMSLNIKKSDFVKSASKPSQYPLSSYPEFFFAGKSNSGKSSMLNAICNRKKLARTSKTPGRTQLINFFLVNDCLSFVDIPGYGYASTSKKISNTWNDMVIDYLSSKRNIVSMFITIDVRRGIEELDEKMIDLTSNFNIKTNVVITKSDKVSKSSRFQVKRNIEKTLSKQKNVKYISIFSSKSGEGIQEIRDIIEEMSK